MSPLWPCLAMAVCLVTVVVRRRRALREPGEIVRPNYAGRPVPLVLGPVLVRSANAGLLGSLVLALLAGPVPGWPTPLLLWAGTYVLLTVGRADDRVPEGPRGISAHLRSLLDRRPTTGVWKLIAGVAVSVVIAAGLGGGLLRVVTASIVIGLSINVVNALDVLPGRALKTSGFVLIAALFPAWGHGVSLALSAYVVAVALLLRWDLEERGMLGDAGSNPLGLVVGTGLAAVLPLWGLLVAMLFLAGLQVAAETVTISRLIEAVPPLRWFDRLGRRD